MNSVKLQIKDFRLQKKKHNTQSDNYLVRCRLNKSIIIDLPRY